MNWIKAAAIALLIPQVVLLSDVSAETRKPFYFEKNDRVVILGDAFVERMQAFGYLETLLAARHANLGLTFRNLGWSGDTVHGAARAVFGTTADGYKRLVKDLREAKPTVILVCYGANEAHQGQAGLAEFKRQLGVLLDELQSTDAAVVLVSPTPQEYVGPLRPDPSIYNKKLALYCDLLQQAAVKRGLPYVNLLDGYPGQLKENGLHFGAAGYWRMSFRLAEKLGSSLPSWAVSIEADSLVYDATNTAIGDLKIGDTGVSFTAVDRRLPPSPRPEGARGASRDFGVLTIGGLAAGDYELRIDGKTVLTTDSANLANGVDLPTRGGAVQSEQLRRLIESKNVYFFYRYRPQNETYLFLFRKHEQGNNAVEIPQFDPLVAEGEKAIWKLAKPQRHNYEVRRKQ